jgi:hypothetical protein
VCYPCAAMQARCCCDSQNALVQGRVCYPCAVMQASRCHDLTVMCRALQWPCLRCWHAGLAVAVRHPAVALLCCPLQCSCCAVPCSGNTCCAVPRCAAPCSGRDCGAAMPACVPHCDRAAPWPCCALQWLCLLDCGPRWPCCVSPCSGHACGADMLALLWLCSTLQWPCCGIPCSGNTCCAVPHSSFAVLRPALALLC